MALANCTLSTLTSAAKCFNCLSSTEKQALKVWFMAQAAKAAGGTDLTDQATRDKAAVCFECEPDFMLESMEVAVWQSFAQNMGATVPTAIADLRKKISCVPCGEQKKQRAAALVLLCSLQANVTP